ncbi:hypothetical protein AB0B85_15075 [Micromonospora sp. NPDC049044]|uniref:hypothetical protein n=1 Tax=unclassified Micromonospora TaxID=2617518 RepID=UPI003405737B
MLIIAADKATYPPNGQIPNLEDDEKACAEIGERIKSLLPAGFEGDVLGQLITWSGSTLGRAQTFDTWADAVRAATTYAQDEFAGNTDQRQRDEALDNTVLDRLGAAVLSTGRTGDPQIERRDKSRRWANCGLAAFQIREQLQAKGGKLVRQSLQAYGVGKGADLKKALLALPASADTVLLLDCQFPQVHNFIIEAHHDGSRYLAQGYQGSYFAHWWLGLDDSYSGTPTAEILALRERYGLGRRITAADYESLLDGLAAAISSDWQETADQWKTLPFNPDRQEVDGIRHRSNSPTFLVEAFELCQPAVARAALGGHNGPSLSELATRGLTTD